MHGVIVTTGIDGTDVVADGLGGRGVVIADLHRDPIARTEAEGAGIVLILAVRIFRNVHVHDFIARRTGLITGVHLSGFARPTACRTAAGRGIVILCPRGIAVRTATGAVLKARAAEHLATCNSLKVAVVIHVHTTGRISLRGLFLLIGRQDGTIEIHPQAHSKEDEDEEKKGENRFKY